MNFGLQVSHYTRGLLCLLTIFLLSVSNSYSQLIEKAPPSPVVVTTSIADSLNQNITISNIVLTGYKRTKPYIIQREIPFKEGDTISSKDLNATLTLCKQRLMNTTLFVDVTVNALRIDSSAIKVRILVKERWYFFPIPYFKIVSRNLNTWWVEEKRRLDRVEYGLKFMQKNVTGRNDNLNLWFVSGYTQQVSLRYDNPNIDKKLQNGINVGVGYKRSRELNYGMDSVLPNKLGFFKQEDRFIYNQWYVDFSYIYRPAIKTRHIVRTSYSNFSISDTVVKLNPDY
ncbi:MAG TPA: POTRA domain-containing protein, partial [Segetibacter sp.]